MSLALQVVADGVRHAMQEFLRPIITPYELEIALQPEPQWTGKYILDFAKLALNDDNDASTTTSKLPEYMRLFPSHDMRHL